MMLLSEDDDGGSWVSYKDYAEACALADDLAASIRLYLDEEFGYDDDLTVADFPPGHEPIVAALARYREARK